MVLWHQTGRLRTVKYVQKYVHVKTSFLNAFQSFLKICFTSRSIFPDNFYKTADSSAFQAKAASRDYHVYKETTWRNALEIKSTDIAVLIRSNLGQVL